VLNVKAFATEH